MTKRAIFRLSLAFITSLISISLVYAQNQNKSSQQAAEDDVIRVNTTFVTLPVSVMDSHGRLIQDLKREDFHLYEDGVAQEIAYFEPPGDARPDSPHKPFTIALLLDVSDSTEFKLEQIRTVALAFLNLLHPEDRVIIVAFDKRVQILAEATNDRDTLSAAIKRARTGGGTSLYLAIDTVINRRLSRVAGRKAVVLLTDGVDTASIGATSDSTIRAAQSSDVVIYPIQYNTYGDFADNSSRETAVVGDFGQTAHVTKSGESASEAYKRGTLYLRLLADKTAGHFQGADRAKNLARSFERIAAQLRQQYTLGYYPKNKLVDGAQRQIKVEVGFPKAKVRTRKSYIYQPPIGPREKQ